MIGILASFMCDLSGFFDAGGLYHFIQIHKFYRFVFVDCFGMLSALAELLQCNMSAKKALKAATWRYVWRCVGQSMQL